MSDDRDSEPGLRFKKRQQEGRQPRRDCHEYDLADRGGRPERSWKQYGNFMHLA